MIYDDVIKEHYDRVAKSDQDSPTSTMADSYIRESETSFIRDTIFAYTHLRTTQHIADGGYANGPGKGGQFSVLDVGCGNGYTLERMSQFFPTFQFSGVEFNASMREVAANRFSQKAIAIAGGDVRILSSSTVVKRISFLPTISYREFCIRVS